MKLSTVLAALLALGACGCGPGAPPDRIVLIIVDTLRRDQLSVYGAATKTPNVERLARAGYAHQDVASSFHQTSMSMAAIFSGRTPSIESGDPRTSLAWNASNWCGLARFSESEDSSCVPRKVPLLGEAMRDLGYWTVGITSNPLIFRPFGYERGFDEWIEIEGGQNTLLAYNPKTRARFAQLRAASAVNEAVFSALRKRKTDRFFLYVHYMDVHDWHLRRVSYASTVEEFDEALGELLDFLEDEGLLRGTVVVLTGDHGEALGEEHLLPATPRHIANPSFEPVLGVPFVVSGTEVRPPAGLFRGEDVFGFLTRLGGGSARPASDLEPNELFVGEKLYRTYRSGRWKSFRRRTDDTLKLVDLESDPGELRDLSGQHPEVARAHRERVDELTAALGAEGSTEGEMTPEFLERLRVLGYLDEPEPDGGR